MTKRDNKVMGFSNIKKIGMGTVCLILTVSFTGEMHVNAASLKTAGVSSAIELNASGLRANQLLAKATLNRDDREAKQKEKSSADSDLVMANIRSSLSIRVSPDINAEKTGILYKDNGGRILERKNGWTKLQSGNVVGWAKDTNLLFGDSARKLADEVGVDVVTVQTDALRVREAADENARTLGLLVRGDQYDILKPAKDGWIAIDYENETGYVQVSFVESTFRIDAGETVAEINQREEEEKKAIEQAKKEKAALAEKIQEEARAKDAALAKAKKARELATAAEKKAQEKKAQETKRQEAEAASEAASSAASVDAGATEETKEAAPAQDESAAADVQALQAAAAAAEAEAKAAESAAQTAQSEESEDVKLLASLIYCEAGNQPHEGKVAVGSVVMNRLNSPAYPNTLAGVIYASGQFTPARSGKVDRIYRGGNIQADSIAAAKEALAGSAPVGGATHFRRKGNRQGTIIGAHVFY